ncbi:hypothetical protein AwDysgo_00250 [Bacteroidales bacterium]|nr:hypothetical protein AwDysgo_00250 [Bacteroidales bacterium]
MKQILNMIKRNLTNLFFIIAFLFVVPIGMTATDFSNNKTVVNMSSGFLAGPFEGVEDPIPSLFGNPDDKPLYAPPGGDGDVGLGVDVPLEGDCLILLSALGAYCVFKKRRKIIEKIIEK